MDDRLLDRYAWLSFKDWAGIHKDDFFGNKQHGSWDDDARLSSIYYDFFVGKKDISQAIAYKVFEAVKTVMILYLDTNQEHAFNLEDAKTFLNGVKKGRVGSANTLKEPISHYTLSPSQQAFLLDTDNPDRNALIGQATEAVLSAMALKSELKVPAALSLDGATFDDKLLTTDTSKRPARRISFWDRSTEQYKEAASSSFTVHPITPQMGFERKVAGFECPD